MIYRDMILRDPDGWMHDRHFRGGTIPNDLLRGNGVTARVLGIPDLEPVWPDLLREAVADTEPSRVFAATGTD